MPPPPLSPPAPPPPPPALPEPPPILSFDDPQTWVEIAWEVAKNVWNYEILTIEGEALGIGRIIVAVVLLVLGVALSRRLSGFASRRVFKRFHLSIAAETALQSVTLYALLLFFTLTALRLANVPMSVFAVLGGALAIGVGFGSQTVVNNFISGIILLIEQPLKAGDVIEIGDTFGEVLRIGARSTILRTLDNTEIVIPNSHLLENSVSNWTLSDKRVRSRLIVGVAYGSDTERVKEILCQVANDHAQILPQPQPNVLFTDFGDSALIFELVFWQRLRHINDRRRVPSELRFEINRLFAEAGVTIPFPQRDVHLDSLSPVKVEVGEED